MGRLPAYLTSPGRHNHFWAVPCQSRPAGAAAGPNPGLGGRARLRLGPAACNPGKGAGDSPVAGPVREESRLGRRVCVPGVGRTETTLSWAGARNPGGAASPQFLPGPVFSRFWLGWLLSHSRLGRCPLSSQLGRRPETRPGQRWHIGQANSGWARVAPSRPVATRPLVKVSLFNTQSLGFVLSFSLCLYSRESNCMSEAKRVFYLSVS
jgi:hypothetical protein